MSTVDNTNFLSVNNFSFNVLSLPNVTFFVQKLILPGVSANATLQKNPFSDIKLGGDKGDYDTLDVTFILDAEMNSYIELFKWWKGVVSPVNFTDYANMATDTKQHSANSFYRDLTVGILNSSGKAVKQITYYKAFPLSLSTIELAYDLKTVNYPTITAKFAYTNFDFI
jgi:hypothetical protein